MHFKFTPFPIWLSFCPLSCEIYREGWLQFSIIEIKYHSPISFCRALFCLLIGQKLACSLEWWHICGSFLILPFAVCHFFQSKHHTPLHIVSNSSLNEGLCFQLVTISRNNKRSSHIKKCKWLPHCHPVTVPVRQGACVLGNLTAELPATPSALTQCEYYKGHTSSTQRMSADAAGVWVAVAVGAS